MQNQVYDVAVIGGGASGMMAAIAAKSRLPQGRVLLLERNDSPGRKLLATGNGRCNFTNVLTEDRDYGEAAEFVRPTLESLGPRKVMDLLESMGIWPRVEDGGRVYPYSGQGAAVNQALQRRMEQLGVEVHCGAEVAETVFGAEFHLVLKGGERVFCRRLILATGGKAGGQYGCRGDGYQFARQLGHSVEKVRPALVAVNCTNWDKAWKGVRAQAAVSLWRTALKESEEPRCVAEDLGEVQFTDAGLSGICVFNLSRSITYTGNMKEGRNEAYEIRVDFLPEETEEQVGELLKHRREWLRGQTADALRSSVVHDRLVEGLLRRVELAPLTIVCDGESSLVWPEAEDVTDRQIRGLAALLKGWRFAVEGTKGWNDAQVTAGGVCRNQVDSVTMESLVQSGLYLCGEVLDVDGRCGGYNLQWAFASGWTAGLNAAAAVTAEAAHGELRKEKRNASHS